MKPKFLLIILLVLTAFSTTKAETIQLGSGSDAQIEMPLCSCWKYGLTQQIYTSSEIGKTGTITSIGFKIMEDLPSARTIDIYLVKTAKSQFSNQTDYLSAQESDKVFSGSVSFTTERWTTITFDKPFTYDGSTNLCLIVNDKTGSYTAAKKWLVYSAAGQAIYSLNDAFGPYNPVSPESVQSQANCQLLAYKSQLQLTFGGGSGPVTTIQLGSGDNSNVPLPVNLNFSHSVSQQIYTAQEIARTGTITTIGFKSVSQSGGATEPQTRYIDLYLVKTNKKEFTSDEDWVSVSESDKVFSGSVTFALDDWTSIRLSKPFEYDGLENLCLVANDKTGSSGKKVYWSVYNDKRETGIYFAGGSSPHNPASLPAADWRVSYKNQLQLTFVGGDSFEPSLDPRVVEIKGDETSASSVLPTTSAAKHSLSQQIYTKDELGEPKDLTSISFFNSGEKRIRSISIYLVHTNKMQFAITNPDGNKSNDWVSFAAADRVFDGEVTFEAADWTAIRLNKTFGYNGSDNLALIVVDDTWTNPSGLACSVFSTQAENQSLSVHSDDEAFDAEHIGEYFGTPEGVKNVVRFNEEDTKVKPTSIEVSNIEWNSVLVTWESEGSKWNLQYRENRTSNWIDIPGLTSKSYKLESLAEDTYYFVRVQVDGGSGNLSEWASTGFETPKRFPSPTDLAASHIRPNSVRLQWTDNSGASSWDIVLFDGENRKILSSNKPHCNVYDLEEGTEYQAWVRAAFNEAAEEYSEWAGPAEFTTLENNPAPSDIAVEPARFSATISWKGISESYNVMYRKKAQDGIFGFDDGTFQNWTTIDADGDGYTWATSTDPGDYFSGSTTLEGTGFADSKAFLLSGSFVSIGHRALTPDNYLVSPLVELGGNIRFYVRAQDANYANEHFGVAVSLTSNTDPDAFTLLQEWTLNANGTGSKGTRRKAQGNWGLFSVDLSAYAGKQGYVAIRHFNCTDQFVLCIDDIIIAPPGWEEEPWISVETKANQLTVADLQPETGYEFKVIGKMDGFDDASSPTGKFTTLENNSVPYDVAVTTGTTSATISWKGISDQYEVWYRPEVSFYGVWVSMSTNNTEFTLDGLKRNTKYQFMVKSIKDGKAEASTDIMTFKTTGNLVDIVFYNEESTGDEVETNNGVYANVTLAGRTLKKDGKWQTLCLPFDVDIENSPLAGADIRTVESVTIKNDLVILNCQTPVAEFKAGVPYIVRWKEGDDIEDPVFEGVIIQNRFNNVLLCNEEIKFVGAYSKSTFPRGYAGWYRVMEDGNPLLAPCDDGTVVNAFDAYLHLQGNIYDITEDCVVNTGEEDELITGASAPVAAGEGAIYNLAGMRLTRKQKGINIVGGRKVLVR